MLHWCFSNQLILYKFAPTRLVMGLRWLLESQNKDKNVLEFIGAERCDIVNTRHREISGKIIESFRRAASIGPHSPGFVWYWSQSDETILNDMSGMILAETIPIEYRKYCPSWNSPFRGIYGIESFSGNRIANCKLLPQTVRHAAYQDRNPYEMKGYSQRLNEFIPTELPFDFDELKAVVRKDEELQIENASLDIFYDVESLMDAAEWLEFWAKHPINLRASY